VGRERNLNGEGDFLVGSWMGEESHGRNSVGGAVARRMRIDAPPFLEGDKFADEGGGSHSLPHKGPCHGQLLEVQGKGCPDRGRKIRPAAGWKQKGHRRKGKAKMLKRQGEVSEHRKGPKKGRSGTTLLGTNERREKCMMLEETGRNNARLDRFWEREAEENHVQDEKR